MGKLRGRLSLFRAQLLRILEYCNRINILTTSHFAVTGAAVQSGIKPHYPYIYSTCQHVKIGHGKILLKPIGTDSISKLKRTHTTLKMVGLQIQRRAHASIY